MKMQPSSLWLRVRRILWDSDSLSRQAHAFPKTVRFCRLAPTRRELGSRHAFGRLLVKLR